MLQLQYTNTQIVQGLSGNGQDLRKTTAKPIQCDMSRVTLPNSEVQNFEIKKSVQKVSLNSFEKPEIFEKNRI